MVHQRTPYNPPSAWIWCIALDVGLFGNRLDPHPLGISVIRQSKPSPWKHRLPPRKTPGGNRLSSLDARDKMSKSWPKGAKALGATSPRTDVNQDGGLIKLVHLVLFPAMVEDDLGTRMSALISTQSTWQSTSETFTTPLEWAPRLRCFFAASASLRFWFSAFAVSFKLFWC